MAFMSILASAVDNVHLDNWIGKFLLLLADGIGNFGWTVVVFSIILRLIMSPLDIWQKFSMRKQQAKMAALQPKMAKLQKQYGNNPDMLKQKQYELQRSANINMLSSCLPMIISMIIFFVVFAGFRELIVYENQLILAQLSDIYTENVDKVDTATLNTMLAEAYKPESWLWIKNVFMSDIGTNVIPTFENFTSTGMGGIGAVEPNGLAASYETLVGPAMAEFNKTGTWDAKNWNGYFVLPILAIATSFLSTWLLQKMNPQTGMTGDAEQDKMQKNTMKVMNYIMPLMLGFFAIMYSAAFAIYYVMSNILMTVAQVLFTVIMNAVDKKKAAKAN